MLYATSDNGTDITLEDRKNEYPSTAVCQDECDFTNYNYTTKKAICSCHAKESSLSFADMKIDKKQLLDNFKDIKNIENIKLLKCVKVLFSKIGILKNVGFYIFNAIVILHAIILILFYKKKLSLLINIIKCLISAIKYLKAKKGEEIEKNEDENVKEKKEEIIEIKENKIRFDEVNDNNIINVDNNFGNENEEKIKIKKKRKKRERKRDIKL